MYTHVERFALLTHIAASHAVMVPVEATMPKIPAPRHGRKQAESRNNRSVENSGGGQADGRARWRLRRPWSTLS